MLSQLIAEYKLYLNVSRYFRHNAGVDRSTWPLRWQECHANDAQAATHWWRKAMELKQIIRDMVKGEYSL